MVGSIDRVDFGLGLGLGLGLQLTGVVSSFIASSFLAPQVRESLRYRMASEQSSQADLHNRLQHTKPATKHTVPMKMAFRVVIAMSIADSFLVGYWRHLVACGCIMLYHMVHLMSTLFLNPENFFHPVGQHVFLRTAC